MVMVRKTFSLTGFLATLCTLVLISSSHAEEPPTSKFIIKRLQIIINEQGYEIPVDGRLDSKTNGLIRDIFKRKFPDTNFSYEKFFTLKKQTEARDKTTTYEKHLSRKEAQEIAIKKAASEEDLLVKNLFAGYELIANEPPLASQKILELMKTPAFASRIPDIYFLGPSTISNADLQYFDKKYGEKFTDIHRAATENNDVNALKVLVKIYSIFSIRKIIERKTRLSLIARWTAQAANAGDLQSIVDLGYLVDNGQGVVASRSKALQIYQYARDLGFKGPIAKLDKVNAQKKFEGAKRKRWEQGLKATRGAPPSKEAVDRLVKDKVMSFLCTKNNHILGAARSGSTWNIITALSPDTMRRDGNQCILKHLAGEYSIGVDKVSKTYCSKTIDGYDCSFGFSIYMNGPGMELYEGLLSLSKLIQPATAAFSIRKGQYYPLWAMTDFKMLGE